MKLQIVSDLHVEFQRGKTAYTLPKTDADAIVLAGDVGVGFEEEFEFCKALIDEHNKPVIFVLGNHSFYGHLADVSKIRKLWEAVDHPNLHYLDEGRHVILNDTLFLGGILWTDFSLDSTGENPDADDACMANALMRMNDYHGTLFNDEPWTPALSVREHWKTRLGMYEILAEHDGMKTVVVSHHLPSYVGVDPKYRSSDLDPAYASHLDHMLSEHDITLWCHGHVHCSNDYNVEGTRVICNPRGYYNHDENPNFIPELVVEI